MSIRVLVRDDAVVYQALRLAALDESPDAFGSTAEEDRLLSMQVVADRIAGIDVVPRRVVYGAFDGERMIGFVGCMQEHKLKSRHKAMIWGMYVHPDARAQGIGQALLSALIAHARGWEGVERLTLNVAEDAQSAKALYARAGFVLFGVEPDGLRVNGQSIGVEYWTCAL